MDFDDLSLEVLDMNQCIFHGGVGGNLDSDDSLTTLSTFYAHHLHFDNLFLEVLNMNQHFFMEV